MNFKWVAPTWTNMEAHGYEYSHSDDDWYNSENGCKLPDRLVSQVTQLAFDDKNRLVAYKNPDLMIVRHSA